MPRNENRLSILSVLIIYTFLFIAAQLIFVFLFFKVNGFLSVASNALAENIFFSRVVFFPFLYFISAQIILYVIYIYTLWYVINCVCRLFKLNLILSYYLTLITWILSVTLIVLLNMYYVPHSLFTSIIREVLLNNALTDYQLSFLLLITLILISIPCLLALIQSCLDIMQRKNVIHLSLMLVIVVGILFSFNVFSISQSHKKSNAATAHQPNIIIIGFDAIRPDYLHYFNSQRPATPHFDSFLNSSLVFTQAYTPLARTLPSWGGILTGKYPIHSHIRENNVYISTKELLETLPHALQKAGYETIYATDDRRFNNIDKRYGFDQLVGPAGTIADFFIGSINDYPLSNLFVPSKLGKILFPYSYANHGAQHTYDVNNFLDSINDAIQKTKAGPLFLAVHFDLSAWPFVWFNDHQAYNVSLFQAYSESVLADDRLLSQFLDLLKENQLLEHAIVVLLSDHGISLALPGDRLIKEENFQGNKLDMKVRRTKYASKMIRLPTLAEMLDDVKKEKMKILMAFSNDSSQIKFNNYGTDTSFGYGGDVLSFKQNHTLLAMKGYGVDFAASHEVSEPVLMLDIAPTLLDLLHLPILPHVDGISLKPFFSSAHPAMPDRTIYYESGFSIDAIEQEGIILSKVLSESIYYFIISPRTGWIMINPDYLNVLITNKQRAILKGDWMLAYYPVSDRYKIQLEKNNKDGFSVSTHHVPAYFVLVNMKTGQWTTETNQSLFLHSPSSMLSQLMNDFYGSEMNIYANRA